MPASDACNAGCVHPLWKTVAFAIAHALLFFAAFPPLGIWPLAFLAPVPLAWLALHARTTRRAVGIALVALVIAWLGLNFWMHRVTLAGYLALAVYCAAYGAVFVWLLREVSRHPRFERMPMSLVLPVLWGGLEAVRGEVLFDGYPWFMLAHPVIELPVLAQTADLAGSYVVGFVVAAVAGALVDLLRWHAGFLPRRRALAFVTIAVVAVALDVAYGVVRMRQGGATAGPLVVAIQTNLPQDNKVGWSLAEQQHDLARFIEATRDAVREHPEAELVVWPETMMPGMGLAPETRAVFARWQQDAQIDMTDRLLGLSSDLDAPMLVGSMATDGLDVEVADDGSGSWTWDRRYNSAYLLEAGVILDRYDKVFLTPFGEVMPYISAWPWLEERLLALGAAGMTFSLDAGEAARPLAVPTSGGPCMVATPICFEDSSGRVCRRMVHEGGEKRTDMLINLSNDGWFGDSDGARRQHAQIARYRCIENRVPMVRCVNTGTSIAIDARGVVVGRIGSGTYGTPRQTGVLAARPGLDPRTTLYGRIGEVWVWICVLAAPILPIWSRIVRRSRRRKT